MRWFQNGTKCDRIVCDIGNEIIGEFRMKLFVYVELEAESCLCGGVIEGLSRFEQLNHDIKAMNTCGYIDEDTANILSEIVKSYYDKFMVLLESGKCVASGERGDESPGGFS